MFLIEYYPALLLFAFSSSVTPGPNNVMILASGLNHGVRRSIPHLLGVVLGFPAMLVILGFFLGFIFVRYPAVHFVIKLLGILYLLFLAWKIAGAVPGKMGDSSGSPLTFVQSALFQWINPKGLIMATGAIATYTTNDANQFLQVLVIALTFVLATFLCSGSWLVFGASLKHLLAEPRHMRAFNQLMALLLVLSILPVLLDVAGS
jgi:threonine/homoserine/homoserine lactone efflux protein